jgi:hypothetical protein
MITSGSSYYNANIIMAVSEDIVVGSRFQLQLLLCDFVFLVFFYKKWVVSENPVLSFKLSRRRAPEISKKSVTLKYKRVRLDDRYLLL